MTHEMTKIELERRLMKCDLIHTLGVTITKGDMRTMDAYDLERLLQLYDAARNAQYEAQALVTRTLA